jgi:hypothetical protein
MESLKISVKIIIFPWAFKNANSQDGSPIGHLLYFLIAAPEIEKFFSEAN